MSECRSELQTSIRDDGVIKTKALKNMREEELGYAGSINVFETGRKDYILCKAMVDHDQQGIIPQGGQKIRDKVDRELLE